MTGRQLYADVTVSTDVPLPPKQERKAKVKKLARVTLADRLNELAVGASFFKADVMRTGIVQNISTLKSKGKVGGAFEVIAYGPGDDVGKDEANAESAGVRIWRTEAAKPALKVAAE